MLEADELGYEKLGNQKRGFRGRPYGSNVRENDGDDDSHNNNYRGRRGDAGNWLGG